MGTPETQDLFTRIGALEHTLALSLRQIAKLIQAEAGPNPAEERSRSV